MSKTPPAPWTRTTKARPCPQCGGSGCLVSGPTDPAAVVCSRVASDRPIGSAGPSSRCTRRPAVGTPGARALNG